MAQHGSSAGNGPLILALENSSMCGSVALVTPELCLAEHSLSSTTTHSRRLLTTVQQLMEETGVGWERIDAIAVSAGPGSFTGLRIGLTTAKGLAMAITKPLIAVSSTRTLACQVGWTERLICPVIDARKHEVYTALYRCTGTDAPCRVSEICAITPAGLAERLAGEEVILLGDGSRIYHDLLRERLGPGAHFASPDLYFLRAAALGHSALGKWEKREFIDPASAIPHYIRASEAEINRHGVEDSAEPARPYSSLKISG